MLFAFATVSATVALGLYLATRPRQDWRLGLVHGGLGALGLAALAGALGAAGFRGPFAFDVVALIGAGLLVGIAMALIAWRTGRPPRAALVLHAALGGIGYLILAGFALS